jgi:glycosyltransferase involved in cell wall biosynthesis
MSEPLVSVITPTRNRRNLLEAALDSVAAQTLGAWEHLVIDDGSDDGTPELMAARGAEDPRVRYLVRQGPCSGANLCRNMGIKAAQAPFVVMLDSDDVLAPQCLQQRAAVMSRNADLDFATFQSGVFVSEIGDTRTELDPQLVGDDLCRFLYFEAPWIITAPIWRRDTLVRLGLFDETLLSWQDIELHVRAISAGCRYVRFPEVDHHIRWQFEPGKISVEQRRSPRHLDGALDVIERLERHVRGGPGLNWVRQRALCSLYFFVAERWVERGDLAPALKAWRSIRDRELGPAHLHASGAALLRLRAAGAPCGRLIHKWKGWARLRTVPELVAGQA